LLPDGGEGGLEVEEDVVVDGRVLDHPWSLVEEGSRVRKILAEVELLGFLGGERPALRF
jgi:hypothetical protein